jgi:NhaP-type Na+/H+ or K+/H+ antiporter
VGGLVLGVVFGMFTSYVLNRLFNDPILEVNTTLVTCYIVFYIAEGTSLHVSGILALVALGLYMSRSGKNNISNGSEASVHHVWITI